jgi:hypothetical protein
MRGSLVRERGAGLDADDRDFIGQRRPELAGKNPGARAHIDDQIGGRCLGEHVGKVRNQPIGVAWPVLAILLGEPVAPPRVLHHAATSSSRRVDRRQSARQGPAGEMSGPATRRKAGSLGYVKRRGGGVKAATTRLTCHRRTRGRTDHRWGPPSKLRSGRCSKEAVGYRVCSYCSPLMKVAVTGDMLVQLEGGRTIMLIWPAPALMKCHNGKGFQMAYQYRAASSGPGWDPKWCFKKCSTFRNQRQPPSSNGHIKRTQARGVGPSPLHSALHAPSRAASGDETVGFIVGDPQPKFLCPHNYNSLGSRLGGDHSAEPRYRRTPILLLGSGGLILLLAPILDLV